MWKSDLIEMLMLWNNDLLIDNIRLNTFGEVVIQATNNKFYIYRDNKIIPFKE